MHPNELRNKRINSWQGYHYLVYLDKHDFIMCYGFVGELASRIIKRTSNYTFLFHKQQRHYWFNVFYLEQDPSCTHILHWKWRHEE